MLLFVSVFVVCCRLSGSAAMKLYVPGVWIHSLQAWNILFSCVLTSGHSRRLKERNHLRGGRDRMVGFCVSFWCLYFPSSLSLTRPLSIPARGDGEACLCGGWVGALRTQGLYLLNHVIGCCRPILHMGSDKSRLVQLPQSCGQGSSF